MNILFLSLVFFSLCQAADEDQNGRPLPNIPAPEHNSNPASLESTPAHSRAHSPVADENQEQAPVQFINNQNRNGMITPPAEEQRPPYPLRRRHALHPNALRPNVRAVLRALQMNPGNNRQQNSSNNTAGSNKRPRQE